MVIPIVQVNTLKLIRFNLSRVNEQKKKKITWIWIFPWVWPAYHPHRLLCAMLWGVMGNFSSLSKISCPVSSWISWREVTLRQTTFFQTRFFTIKKTKGKNMWGTHYIWSEPIPNSAPLVSGGCLPVSISGDKIPILVISCLHYRRSLLSDVFQFSSVWSLSRVWLFATPWTAACQVSLSFTISQSLLRLMSIESVMPFKHLILCCPLPFLPSVFPSIRIFSNELAAHIRWPKCWSSASASVLPMSIQDCFPFGLTGLIALLSKRLSRVFSRTTVQKHQFFGTQLSL